MSVPAGTPREASANGDAVHRQLGRILASPGFGSAERRARLLRYLVDKALSGEPVKEYGIGIDVFDKPADYDPRLDPSVRVEIGRLRTKLSEYYSAAGTAELRIEIPKGSYVPIFEVPSAAAPAPLEKTTVRLAEPPGAGGTSKNFTRLGLAGIALMLITAALLIAWLFPRHGNLGSVVVLPFANLTGDARNDYLADGVTEQLTDALAQIPTLRVVARTSAFQFKGRNVDVREIGRAVGADAVIEGSVARVEEKLRLTVQVNRSRDGYHIFSRVFEGPVHDLARLERDLSAPVAAALQPNATIPQRATPDPEAYDLFMRARAFRGDGTRASSDQALTLLHQAIERDPGYADAYAALAGVYAFNATSLVPDPIEYANQARAAALKALELDSRSGAAYSALGYMDAMVLLDWKRGEEELGKAIALAPQNAASHSRLGNVLMAQARFPEAIGELQKSADLDPLMAAPHVATGLAYLMSRDYDAALRRFSEARDLHPETLIIHAFVGVAWELKGDFGRALDEYKIVEAKSPGMARVFRAHLAAAMGKTGEARALLAGLEHPPGESPNPFDVAAVYAALGDRDSAFRWLDRAHDQRIIWFLKVHPFLDPLRGDTRYTALLKKANLD